MKRFFMFLLLASLLVACGGPATPVVTPCSNPPERSNAVEEGVKDGAVIVYERLGVGTCVSDVWKFYPDGRIVGDNGRAKVENQVTPEEITTLLNDIDGLGFYELESTTHTACQACYTYYITLNLNDQVKTVSAVDGGTDVRGEYWQIFAKIKRLISDFPAN